ncbi:MAG: hypothetical protein IT201_05285 [Thermoleophilia bacterium]|nr:hypothetical protein [Thermoleophilia bacterium]
MIAAVACADALYLVELGADAGADELVGREPGGSLPGRERPVELVPPWAASLLVDLDAVGSTIVLALDRRPPLLVSHDLGGAWSECGSGLPRAVAVAVSDNPDRVLYAGRNRLYVSLDGGRFWRSAGVELPEIRAVAWG